MSKINDKLGLKPAGQRAMMKLPADRALRNVLTATKCPMCQNTGARLSQIAEGWFRCSWCSHTWNPVAKGVE